MLDMDRSFVETADRGEFADFEVETASPEELKDDDSAKSWIRGGYAQRRVDALGLLAEASLGEGLGSTDRGNPYQVMIHVDSAVLADQSHEGLREVETGEGISAESCRRLACDAPHVTVGPGYGRQCAASGS